MKKFVKKITIVTGLVFSGMFTYAQVTPPVRNVSPPPAPVAPGVMPPVPPMGPGPVAGPQRGLQVLSTLTGEVTGYTANERNAYNGFTLQTGSQSINVKFPEHMGEQLMQAAKKGQTITISGYNETDPAGVNQFRLVSAKTGNTLLTETPPTPPAETSTPVQKNYSGKISDFRRDQQGIVNGFILDSKEIIELPPNATLQLQSLLKAGDKVEVSGFKIIPPAGVVMAQNNVSIRPQTITLNGQTYLIR